MPMYTLSNILHNNMLILRCPTVKFVHLLPSPAKETRFSLRVFEFTSSRSDVVYIHCQVSVCSTNSSMCATDCSPANRKKRDLSLDSSHLLSTGPLMLLTDNGKRIHYFDKFFFALWGKDQLFVNDNFRHSD